MPARHGAAANGVRVWRVGAMALGRARAAGRLADWGSYYALAAADTLAAGRFDACLALTTPPLIGLVGALLKILRHTRLILWSMDVWPEIAEALGSIRPGGPVARGLHWAARQIYGRADAVITLGDCMSRRLAASGVPEGKLRAVHNWVPGESVAPAMPCNAARNGHCTAMYSGNMGQPHEFGTFLDAAEHLRGEASLRFAFVGHGARRAEVKEAVRRKALPNVMLSDPAPLEGLGALLAGGDVHLLSLRPEAEGLLVPSKVYGILAAGRPALMVGPRDNTAARLLLESGAGEVFAPGDAEGLAAAIRRIAKNPAQAQRMGEAGRAYYERHLGRDRSVSRIVELIEN